MSITLVCISREKHKFSCVVGLRVGGAYQRERNDDSALQFLSFGTV